MIQVLIFLFCLWLVVRGFRHPRHTLTSFTAVEYDGVNVWAMGHGALPLHSSIWIAINHADIEMVITDLQVHQRGPVVWQAMDRNGFERKSRRTTWKPSGSSSG